MQSRLRHAVRRKPATACQQLGMRQKQCDRHSPKGLLPRLCLLASCRTPELICVSGQVGLRQRNLNLLAILADSDIKQNY